jgi:hypothetical protein
MRVDSSDRRFIAGAELSETYCSRSSRERSSIAVCRLRLNACYALERQEWKMRGTLLAGRPILP